MALKGTTVHGLQFDLDYTVTIRDPRLSPGNFVTPIILAIRP
jgi:hypothetical protein